MKFAIKIIFSILLFNSFILAQVSNIDKDLPEKLSKSKEKYYQKLIQSDKQMTKNQADFDAKYYSLDLNLNPTTEVLTGIVEGIYEVVAVSINQLELNFWSGMSITDIHLASAPGNQLSYTHNNDLLVVDLGSSFLQGQQIELVISYSGSPQNSNYRSFDFGSYSGQPMIWTRSEPYGARAWWPCKDIPADKADSVDIRITVPNYLTVASNGTLRETTTVGLLTTWWWHEKYPIVTYLVSLDVYPYTVYYDDYIYNNNADTMKIHFYVFPENYNNYFSTNALVKDMIACFDSLFGQYPFIDEKYGHADDLGGGAMEHQTCSSFSFWGESVYAHELAHQWWGDLITCNSFHHIWLNEGFATYSEALWYEYAYPPYTASIHQMNFNRYLQSGTIYVEDPYNQPIFHGGLSYRKASWVVHMLRHIMGDNTFFNFLKIYYASVHQHGTATTEDFKALCEQHTGLNLGKFFQQWIYNQFYPYYSYGYRIYPLGNRNKIQLVIDQIQQNTGLFWMPIDIRITTTTADTIFVVWDSLQSQTFEFFVEGDFLSLELDPNNWILKEAMESPVHPYPINTYINSYYQSPGVDTLIISTKFLNPNNYNVSLSAIIESNDQTVIDTIQFYDDGFHNDSTLNDGIFGSSWPVIQGERDYNIHFITNATDSNFYSTYYNALHFTTHGPIAFDEFIFTTPDTLLNMGDVFGIKLQLRNDGTVKTITNVSAKITSPDSSIIVIQPSSNYNDIAPGQVALSSNVYGLRVNPNFDSTKTVNLNISIESDGNSFWQDSFSVNVVSGILGNELNFPIDFALKQNYPNPFNPNTTIEFSIPETEYVTLKVYNLLGQKVITLASKEFKPGNYTINWDATDFAGGLYFYKLESENYSVSRKMILIK